MMKKKRLVQTQFSFKHYIPFVRHSHTHTHKHTCVQSFPHANTHAHTYKVLKSLIVQACLRLNLKLCSSIFCCSVCNTHTHPHPHRCDILFSQL